MLRKIKLIWDFRGITSEKTALHHAIHLNEYATLEKLTVIGIGSTVLSEMHSIAYLTVEESDMKKVRDALLPHRATLHEE